MIILLFISYIFYFSILFLLFIFLAPFPSDEYWNIISVVFFWLIGIGYLIRIFTKSISIDQLMKHGLIFFAIGVLVSTVGIFVAGEILLKLSFLLFMLGIIGSFMNYRKIINEKV